MRRISVYGADKHVAKPYGWFESCTFGSICVDPRDKYPKKCAVVDTVDTRSPCKCLFDFWRERETSNVCLVVLNFGLFGCIKRIVLGYLWCEQKGYGELCAFLPSEVHVYIQERLEVHKPSNLYLCWCTNCFLLEYGYVIFARENI